MYYDVVDNDVIVSARTRFYRLSKSMRPLFAKEGVSLNFQGYTETLSEYYESDSNDMDTLYLLCQDFSMWVSYFVDMEAITKLLKGKYQNQLGYLESFKTLRENKQLNEKIAECKKTIKDYTQYEKELHKQVKMFSKVYSQMYYEYSKACRNLMRY